uniref:DUF6713 family protein n=1 Tax=Comamonas testosteroni TaxID=285 RepID=UPI0028EFA541
ASPSIEVRTVYTKIRTRPVVANMKTGLPFYKLLACLGLLTIGIHAFFFFQGSESFIQPMSIALMLATFILSIWQLVALRRLEKLP